MGKRIAVVNHKGGVGKTTSCVNLAAALTAQGARVLVCDFDPQGNATSGFGLDKTRSPSVYDVILGGVPISKAIVPTKGMHQLLQTVQRIKQSINQSLRIGGILLTMVDNRTNLAKDVSAMIRESYGSRIRVFDTEIPRSVRAAEITTQGTSIYAHDPGGKVAQAYHALTKEVLQLERQRQKAKSDLLR